MSTTTYTTQPQRLALCSRCHPGHRKHPSGSRQGHPRDTGTVTTGGRGWPDTNDTNVKSRCNDASTKHSKTPVLRQTHREIQRWHHIQQEFPHAQCENHHLCKFIASFTCYGTSVGKIRIPGFGLGQLEVLVRDRKYVSSKTRCLICVGVGKSDGRHKANPSIHAITKISRILETLDAYDGHKQKQQGNPVPQFHIEDIVGRRE